MSQNEISSALKNLTTISKNMFDLLEVVGKGGFGKVWKVQFCKGKTIFALKEMSKTKIIERQMLENVFQEKSILSELYHPFLVNLYCTFQDKDNLYMLMDYMPCSDLRFQIGFIKQFTEDQLKFISACVILGLESIHANGIIHRDIKPENLVIEERGYFRITDFGIAIKIKHDSYINELSGTPGYIPPEVVHGDRVSFESDYFALGIMLYELIMGDRPYNGRNKREMMEEFKKLDPKLTPEVSGYSREMCDFVNRLIEKDNRKRLGRNGDSEVKGHKLFDDFNWKHLYHKTMRSPFNPKVYFEKRARRLSKRKSEEISKDTNDSDSNSNSKQSDSFQNNFLNYTFIHKFTQNAQITNYYNSKLKQNSLVAPTRSKTFRTIVASTQKNIIKSNFLHRTPIKLLSKEKNVSSFNKPHHKNSSPSVSKFKCELPVINNGNTNQNSANTSLLGNLSSPIKRSSSNVNIFKSYILKSAGKVLNIKNNLNTLTHANVVRRFSKNKSVLPKKHNENINLSNSLLV